MSLRQRSKKEERVGQGSEPDEKHGDARLRATSLATDEQKIEPMTEIYLDDQGEPIGSNDTDSELRVAKAAQGSAGGSRTSVRPILINAQRIRLAWWVAGGLFSLALWYALYSVLF